MKILFISPYLPHPLCGHGAGVFIYELIVRMSRRHKITLITFCDEKEEQLAGDLKKLPIRFHYLRRAKGQGGGVLQNVSVASVRLMQLLGSIIRWEPYYVSKYRSSTMSSLIQKTLQEESFDVVQIEFTQMAQYVHLVRNGTTFLHELDVSFRPAYRRYKNSTGIIKKAVALMEWCRWAKYEPAYARIFDRVLTVTDKDRLLLEWLARSGNVRYFPHAVEVGKDIPLYSTRKPRTLVFVGTYSHQPNVDSALWLCKEIFPAIQTKYPDALLYLIGPHATKEMKEYAAANSGIIVTGFVDDVNKYLRECAVFISPLRFGGGVKNKVLFAMAQAIPVVTTPVGAEGIDGIDSSNIVIGETVEKLVDCTGRLFEFQDEAERIGISGLKNVTQWYSWDSVIARLEEIYIEGKEKK